MDDDFGQGQYYGVERDPIPDHPTKKQALDALSMLSFDIRWESKDYYSKIVRRFIDQVKED